MLLLRPPRLPLRRLQRMSSSLAAGSCVPCRRGAPALSDADVAARLRALGGAWQLAPFAGSGVPVLQRSVPFRNFRTALAFTNAVGAMAEAQKHHPALLTEWGSVRVAWWTHAIGGVRAASSGRRGTALTRHASCTTTTSSARPRRTSCSPPPRASRNDEAVSLSGAQRARWGSCVCDEDGHRGMRWTRRRQAKRSSARPGSRREGCGGPFAAK